MKIEGKFVIVLFSFLILNFINIQSVEAITFDPPITILNPETNPDDFFQDFFGNSVAISGNIVLIGEPNGDLSSSEEDSSQGLAHLYDISGNPINIINSPIPVNNEGFGRSVALDGNKALVGANGASYLFDVQGNFLQTLINPNPSSGELFGNRVSLSDNKALVAAQSAAYLFDGTTGSLLQTFLNPDPRPDSNFRIKAITIDGNNVAIGAYSSLDNKGVVNLFDASNGAFLQSFIDPNSDPERKFGDAVAIYGNTIAIGNSDGLVYIFDISDGSLLTTIQPPNPLDMGEFGYTIDIFEDYVVVGARSGNGNFGEAFLFDANDGSLLQTLENPQPFWKTKYGQAVAIDNVNVIVGSRFNLQSEGAAFLFLEESGTSEIIVHTQYGSTEITGYYTVLSQDGVTLETDFTPTIFTVNNGETYNVEVHNFENFEFLTWQDTGSKIASRDFAVSSNTDFIAEYGNIADPLPPGTSELTVRTVNSSGDEIFGYWTVLYQDENMLRTGFSPVSFDLNNGEDYEILLGDYGGVIFDHFEDDAEENPYQISINENKELNAFYLP